MRTSSESVAWSRLKSTAVVGGTFALALAGASDWSESRPLPKPPSDERAGVEGELSPTLESGLESGFESGSESGGDDAAEAASPSASPLPFVTSPDGGPPAWPSGQAAVNAPAPPTESTGAREPWQSFRERLTEVEERQVSEALEMQARDGWRDASRDGSREGLRAASPALEQVWWHGREGPPVALDLATYPGLQPGKSVAADAASGSQDRTPPGQAWVMGPGLSQTVRATAPSTLGLGVGVNPTLRSPSPAPTRASANAPEAERMAQPESGSDTDDETSRVVALGSDAFRVVRIPTMGRSTSRPIPGLTPAEATRRLRGVGGSARALDRSGPIVLLGVGGEVELEVVALDGGAPGELRDEAGIELAITTNQLAARPSALALTEVAVAGDDRQYRPWPCSAESPRGCVGFELSGVDRFDLAQLGVKRARWIRLRPINAVIPRADTIRPAWPTIGIRAIQVFHAVQPEES